MIEFNCIFIQFQTKNNLFSFSGLSMLFPSTQNPSGIDTPLSHSPAYAELLALSNYSFLQGGSHPEELVERAQAMAYAAITISDECSLAGVVRAHVRAKQIGMPLIIGSQCRMDPDHRANLGDTDRLLLLAMNREGYARLSQAISQARQQAPKGSYRWTKAQWDNGLPGCLAVWVPAVRFDHAEVRNRQSACPEGLRDLLDC
ncbi:MAG: error-prone polymerase, partial [Pseudomonadota bacterium]